MQLFLDFPLGNSGAKLLRVPLRVPTKTRQDAWATAYLAPNAQCLLVLMERVLVEDAPFCESVVYTTRTIWQCAQTWWHLQNRPPVVDVWPQFFETEFVTFSEVRSLAGESLTFLSSGSGVGEFMCVIGNALIRLSSSLGADAPWVPWLAEAPQLGGLETTWVPDESRGDPMDLEHFINSYLKAPRKLFLRIEPDFRSFLILIERLPWDLNVPVYLVGPGLIEFFDTLEKLAFSENQLKPTFMQRWLKEEPGLAFRTYVRTGRVQEVASIQQIRDEVFLAFVGQVPPDFRQAPLDPGSGFLHEVLPP